MSHHVYRLFDAEGRLIYIGATGSLARRIREHATTKTWPGCHPVNTIGDRMATWTADEYPSCAEAFAAEEVAIARESPELNTLHRQPKEYPVMTNLPPDYDLDEVAAAFGMSTRWVRERVKEGAEHIRRGRKIRFTAEQVEKLRVHGIQQPASESITTGRKKRSA